MARKDRNTQNQEPKTNGVAPMTSDESEGAELGPDEMTVRQAAEYLELSRVRVLGLLKAGKLIGRRDHVEGTDIPLVKLSRASVESYTPGIRGGNRSFIVVLPAEALAELEKHCADRGWTCRPRNVRKPDVDLDDEEVSDFEATSVASA